VTDWAGVVRASLEANARVDRGGLGMDCPEVPKLAGKLETWLYEGHVKKVIGYLQKQSRKLGPVRETDGEHPTGLQLRRLKCHAPPPLLRWGGEISNLPPPVLRARAGVGGGVKFFVPWALCVENSANASRRVRPELENLS
jgi:hypothetical protein